MGMRLRALIGRTVPETPDGGLVPLKGAARWPAVWVVECFVAIVVSSALHR
jgi:hypothetical protein